MLQILELLHRINSQIMRTLVPAIRAENISVTEMIILWKVHRKGTFRATDLAREADVPPSTFTGIVDRLVAKNYLTRINDHEDRRSVLVQGTPELNKLIEHMVSVCDVKLKEVFKDIPEDFIELLIKDLQTLYKYLLQYEGYEKNPGEDNK